VCVVVIVFLLRRGLVRASPIAWVIIACVGDWCQQIVMPDLIQQLGLVAGDAAEKVGLGVAAVVRT
jgi:hypothetical protein